MTSLQLSSLEVRSRTFHTQPETLKKPRANKKTIARVPRRCVQISILHLVDWYLFYLFKHVSQYNDARPKNRSPNRGKNWYPGRITVPANLVFRLNIWGARDNGIPPRSTPVKVHKQQPRAHWHGGRVIGLEPSRPIRASMFASGEYSGMLY